MNIFETAKIGNLTVKNRIVRSATYEGMCNNDGIPTDNYKKYYLELARNSVGTIITGVTYISKDGKVIQPGQAGIDSEEKISYYRKITDEVHQYDCRIFMQLSHAGRQTSQRIIGRKIIGVSPKKSFYFNEVSRVLKTKEVMSFIELFATSALLSKNAGFDGIQLHAAHGYLIHQFILPSINNRKDLYGIDDKIKIGARFLDLIIDRIKEKCGDNFPILVKISGSDDYFNRFSKKQFINLIKFLDIKKIAGIEISYGTMDYPLNIIRGNSIPIDRVLKYNPRYKINNRMLKYFWRTLVFPMVKFKIKYFSPMYNLLFAKIAKQYTEIPIICVGGFRKGVEIFNVIEDEKIDFVSLCRPFICEPDFVEKLKKDNNYISECISCNRCTVMCDTDYSTRCYMKRGYLNEY